MLALYKRLYHAGFHLEMGKGGGKIILMKKMWGGGGKGSARDSVPARGVWVSPENIFVLYIPSEIVPGVFSDSVLYSIFTS